MVRARLSLAGILAIAVAGVVTGVHVRAASGASAGTNPVDPRDQAVARWIGHSAVIGQWRQVSQGASGRYQARVTGVGLVEVDARSNEVDEVVFEDNLVGAPGRGVSRSTALATATALAGKHYAGFAALQLRQSTRIDHGIVTEYRFEWQGRSHDAWTPSRITVGINGSTGKVMSYWSDRAVVTVPTVAAVDAAHARAEAMRMASLANSTVSNSSLEVVSTPTGQRLVWVTEVTEVFNGGAHIPNSQVFWTDAQTGTTELVART
jgi:hypothetical protein